METSKIYDALVNLVAPFKAWVGTVSVEQFGLALILVVLVIVFRKPISAGLTNLLERLLRALSITPTQDVLSEIDRTLRVLVIALSVYVFSKTLSLPDATHGLIERMFLSVFVLAVFSGWYQVIGPLTAIIDPEKFLAVRVDTSWMERIGQFTVILFGITALLKVWNIDISSALTGVGVLGAGLAIAAQDFIRNLFAGMSNMSEKRFATGDWICVEGIVEGTVINVDVRSTVVMGFDRVPRYVPNSDLSNAIVLNKSRMDHRRVYWMLPIRLDASEQQLEGICQHIIDYMRTSGDFVNEDGTPLMACVSGLSENAVEILIYGFSNTKVYREFMDVRSRLTQAVRAAVTQNDAHIAYHTQTVIVENGTPEVFGKGDGE
ncbi:mechanosensitive ion channel family protein [Phaeobacter marinintestinus]|uniref:mechanosensitive ion channel family protein n=1 Tax=Falsiphaeobacter marinintestinus TaxID=1492905 RepID=UPI0011B40FD4|nr:mechanosensitive ion channel family protein [Phaeobacter marinintestinus]